MIILLVTSVLVMPVPEPTFKRFGSHPLMAYSTTPARSWPGSCGRGSPSNAAAEDLQIVADAIAALPPAQRRSLMMTSDDAGPSRALITRLATLTARRGYEVIYSVGAELSA